MNSIKWNMEYKQQQWIKDGWSLVFFLGYWLAEYEFGRVFLHLWKDKQKNHQWSNVKFVEAICFISKKNKKTNNYNKTKTSRHVQQEKNVGCITFFLACLFVIQCNSAAYEHATFFSHSISYPRSLVQFSISHCVCFRCHCFCSIWIMMCVHACMHVVHASCIASCNIFFSINIL